MRDESFGPIIGIQAVADDDEAVALMNDTEYGLTAGVYTPDEKRAQRILRAVDAGTVYWNCCDRVSPRLPWSGVKHSGIGLTLSTYGIQTFTRPKAWHLRREAEPSTARGAGPTTTAVVLQLRRAQRVREQHRDRHRPDAARHRRDPRRALAAPRRSRRRRRACRRRRD